MKSTNALVIAPLFFLLLNNSAVFAGNEDLEAKCSQWAKEDEIPSNEMADYLKSCVEDLIGKRESGEEPEAAVVSDSEKSN